MIGTGYFYVNKDKLAAKVSTKQETNKALEKEAKAEIEKSFETVTPKEKMPAYETMSNSEIIQEVHKMTHQKVKAEQKWGSSEITKDKVLTLYNVIKNKHFKKYDEKELLLEILEPWTKGDFSNAVTAHNQIWSVQDGTIGKATRLLTPEEEKDYIEENF